jgi:alpha,alpha-trehalase
MQKRPVTVSDKIKSSLVASAGGLLARPQSPDKALGEIFSAVQSSNVFGDGKTFADLVPKTRVRSIKQEYDLLKKDPNFDLREFISRHFYDLSTVQKKDDYKVDLSDSIDQHIEKLWTHLERRNRRNRGSLIALPYSYIVPGGRFNEQFYWDSYFIMRGLAVDDQWDVIEGMVKNAAYLIRKFGHVPTANRTYFLSRSQPPLFSHMVRLLASKKGEQTLLTYLPYLLAEYRFWMKGRNKLTVAEHRAFLRVAEMPDGTVLNRYYDNLVTPRPESLREDTETAHRSASRDPDRLYLHLRAAAESGWDFSSRWFADGKDINTIHAADIIPVDLNALLFDMETTLADIYSSIRQPVLARRFQHQAERRARAVTEYCWNEETGLFHDYNFHHHEQTDIKSAASATVLFSGMATKEQAARIAATLEKEFLFPGGLVTTLNQTDQQWDSPNGWAPIHLFAVEGLRRYGHRKLADTIRKRWLTLNELVFSEHHRMVEKYNVVDKSKLGGGGEYPVQDGFGWTNGVYKALK